MLYSLTGNVSKETAIVDLVSNANRFHAFFLAGAGDDKFLQFTSIQFNAQEGYSPSVLSTADYLEASIGVPIVSKTFTDTLGDAMRNDIAFYPCEVNCAGTVFPFYVGKILTYAQLVNVEISDFRQLTDGRKVLRFPRYNTVAEKDFFIARDQDYPHLFAASEALVSLIQVKGLSIGCKPLPHQH
ncbi:MAG TPA: hypothetical protein VF629_08865 [Hymenobacter sp.]|jgi:hypothetical protein|uniref:hypothetical protein n=1 Tax=Hymenobacter sp. TaxID=1898978 RepID=UPI002EDA88E9